MEQTNTDRNIRETILAKLRENSISHIYFDLVCKGNKWAFVVSENPKDGSLNVDSKCVAQKDIGALNYFLFAQSKAIEINNLEEYIEWVADLYGGLFREEYPDVYCIHYETYHAN